jgi:serine-type D-Ala-D-Ala carboxypeptidase/endopeptidase (penicillin-binding protein 4)
VTHAGDRPRHMAGRPGAVGAVAPPTREPTADGESDGGSDGDGATRHPPRWLAPVALAAVAVAAGIGAVLADRQPDTAAIGADATPATPVLSARRAPEVLAAPVADRRLVTRLQGWLGASPAGACLVVEAEGREVFGHNPVLPVTGASTQKLLTATGLLLALGPDATFETEAVTAQAPEGGVVAGDLFVVGGGDAALATADWPLLGPGNRPKAIHDVDALAQAIAAAGVTRIDGSVVGDGSRYDGERYQPSLPPRLIDQDQVGPIGGLMVNDGFGAFSTERSLASTVPADDTAADFARVLTERLAAHGVTVAGAPRSGIAPDGAGDVATLTSPPLRQIVGEMLANSDNETAESAMKEIGLATAGQGSFAAGAAGLTQLLTDAGVPMDGVRVVDGTGLTTEDSLTCRTLVDTLTREETGPVVREGLAVAGQTGTLEDRFGGTAAAGRLRAKTGTLRNATALAGEVQTLPGGAVTFAYVANVPDPDTVTFEEVGLGGLADILLTYPEGLDVAVLAPLPAA